MINNQEFSKRLKKVLEYYQLSASAFAEKIGVQRSSISHLLSGRNKPSLDFILKVLDTFDEVELYWLLNGKGTFPKTKEPISNKQETAPTLFSSLEEPNKVKSEEAISYDSPQKTSIKKEISSNLKENEIDRIVFFYKDGTFDVYKN